MNSYSPIKLKFLAKLKSNPIFVKLRTAIQEGSYGILPPSESYVEGGNVTLLRATELKPDLEIDISTSPKVPQSFYNSKRACVQKHDILLAVKGATIASAKSVCYVKDEYENTIINGSIYRMSSKPHVIAKYFAYILDSPLTKRQMKMNLVANNAVDYLDSSIIHNLLIPIPPIEIQQQIIDQLDKSYTEKKAKEAEAERLLASVDDLVLDALGITLPDREENTLDKRIFFTKSSEISSGRFDPDALHPERINAMKTVQTSKYQVRKLNEIAKFVRVLTTEKMPNLRYIGLENIQSNTGIYLPKTEVEEFGTANVFESGQVLFPKLRPYLNKVFHANLNGVCSTEFYVLDSFLVSNDYLACFLRTSLIVSQTKRLMTGNTLPRLQTKDVESLQIPIPPPEVQVEIAEQVEAIYAEAKRLREEGKETLKQAKLEVEKMILGKG